MPATIDDPTILREIEHALKKLGYAKGARSVPGPTTPISRAES
jgi:hypothetical protein